MSESTETYPGPITWDTLRAKWFEGRVFAGPSEKYDAEIAWELFVVKHPERPF